jgi:hypothetical protein
MTNIKQNWNWTLLEDNKAEDEFIDSKEDMTNTNQNWLKSEF